MRLLSKLSGLRGCTEDGNERRALHFGAKAGKLATVSHIVSVAGELEPDAKQELIDCVDAEGETALSLACREAVEARVQLLIVMQLVDKGGADVNHTSKSGRAALHHLIDSDNIEVIEYLLSKGADPNTISDMGTPLLSAIMFSRDGAVDALLAASADPNIGAGMAPPAICCAAAMGNGEQVSKLLGAGGSVQRRRQRRLDAAALCAGRRAPRRGGPAGQGRRRPGRQGQAGPHGGGHGRRAQQPAGPRAGRCWRCRRGAPEPGRGDAGQGGRAEAAGQRGHQGEGLRRRGRLVQRGHRAGLLQLRAVRQPRRGKLKLQQFEEALADAQEAKRLAPEWVKAFYKEGEAFFGMENYGDAAASCAPNPATACELRLSDQACFCATCTGSGRA